ncbi:hypothetical protein M0N77_10110 [Psychrobacter sp. AH5]|uniref:hypothetical protein n=1 Tax=Psychrobacter sp. AH5 TaxID=2937433 RepID=UPI00333F0925
MEICSWDWGAIATFTTGIIAFVIFCQWRGQKRSEIMSNEAAKILVILEVYRENLIHLDSEIMKPSENDNIAKLEELRLVARQLCNSAISFGGLASNERTVATQIKNIAATFYNKAKSLDEKSFQEIRGNPKSPILVSEFDAAIKKPKAIIIHYFKYQKFRLFLRTWVSLINTSYSKLKK